jgi:glycosyl transferase, family 25
MTVMMATVRRVTPVHMRRAIRASIRPWTAENRPLTLRRPVANSLLAYQSRRSANAKRHRRIGVDRLSSVMVINLASRPDRLSLFMQEMDRLGVESVQRFEGIWHPYGPAGCTMSHAACVKEIVDNSLPAAMICEDDASFLVDRRQLDVLIDSFLDDPRAEVACLAYFHQRVCGYSRLFLRALESQTMGCYVVKASIAPALLDVLQEGAEQLEGGGDPFRFACDQIWKLLQRDRVFVLPVKRAAYQRPGYSDVERRIVDYQV